MKKPIPVSKRNAVPCCQPPQLKIAVQTFATELSEQAHKIGSHGLSEKEFYESGILDGAIERLRGQKSARMGEKRHFVAQILNHLQDLKRIHDWTSSGGENRFDYHVELLDGRICVIELKGCLDGNNTTIFERPTNANEFVVWSVCQNKAADPEHNVWSGIHVRLGPEIISRKEPVDGLIVWDYLCGSLARPCPKISLPGLPSNRITELGPYSLPPPCLYLFPPTVPSPKDNPSPPPQSLKNVSFMQILHDVFNGSDDELNFVRWATDIKGVSTRRQVEIERGGNAVARSGFTTIKRKG